MRSIKHYWELVYDSFGELLPISHFSEITGSNKETRQIGHGTLKAQDHEGVLHDLGYQYDIGEGDEFGHYTTLDTAFNIIRGRNLRLYHLHKADDPKELQFAADKSSHEALFYEEIIDSLKNCTFYLSLSEAKRPTTGSSVKEDPILWKKYGAAGEGCCLVFSIQNHEYHWKDSALCKMAYGGEGLQPLHDVNKKVREFNSFFPPLYIDLAPVYSVHKRERYRDENEVRLLVFGHDEGKEEIPEPPGWFKKREAIYPKVKQDHNSHWFLELPIYHTPYEASILKKAWMSLPQLVLEEIILGYDLSEEKFEEAANSLHYLSKENLGYMPEIKRSGIR